jgi:membrane protease YdiL (CAAX protease family)
MTNSTPIAVAVLGLELIPAVAFGFASERVGRMIANWPRLIRIIAPSVLVIPYLLLSATPRGARPNWIAIYFLLPVVIAWLLERAAFADPEQRGNWRDAVILLMLGLTVDLRWFDMAWPEGWRGLGNLLLVDAGLYGFLGVRRFSGTGFDFHLRWSDWKTGFRELLFFAPVVIALGILLGFIHPHKDVPRIATALLRWGMIFIFVAIPEELFFRAWMQNLLERRIGRWRALVVASILFGLSHFNKRNPAGQHFNWHYVLLATIAGIFYGRAWRENRRVAASTITHTCVDWLWSWWF